MSLSLDAYADKLVLVTGATGFTGRVVTRKLVEHGAKVRAIARQSSILGDLEDLDIKWFRGRSIRSGNGEKSLRRGPVHLQPCRGIPGSHGK